MKSFLYPLFIKKSNLGDILINVLLIRELSKYGKVFFYGGEMGEITNLVTVGNNNASNIIITKRNSFLDSIPIIRWLGLLSNIKNLQFVFDPPGHYAEQTILKNIGKSFKYTLRAKLLNLFGVEVLRLGVTLGPFSKIGWKMQKMTSKSYKTIAVRDSQNYAEVLKKKVRNISFVDDLSFLYDVNEFLGDNTKNRIIVDPYIVISFRGNVEGHETDFEYLKKVKSRLNKIIEDNPSEVLYIFSYQVKEDLEVIELIKNDFADKGLRINLIKEQLTFSKAIELYSGAKYVYTNRLHVALLAMFNNAPSIVITDTIKHHKIVNVYLDLYLSDLIFDSNNVSEVKTILEEIRIQEIMKAFKISCFRKKADIQQTIKDLL